MLPHFVIPLYSFACLLIHLFLKSVSLRVASREQAHFGPPDSELACFLVCVCALGPIWETNLRISGKKKNTFAMVFAVKLNICMLFCNGKRTVTLLCAHLRTAFSRVCMFRMITKYARSLAVAMPHKRLRDGLD